MYSHQEGPAFAFEILEELACFRGLIENGRNLSSAASVNEADVKKRKDQVEIQLRYTNSLTDMYRKTYPKSAWHFPEDHDLELPTGWNLQGDELRELFNKMLKK